VPLYIRMGCVCGPTIGVGCVCGSPRLSLSLSLSLSPSPSPSPSPALFLSKLCVSHRDGAGGVEDVDHRRVGVARLDLPTGREGGGGKGDERNGSGVPEGWTVAVSTASSTPLSSGARRLRARQRLRLRCFQHTRLGNARCHTRSRLRGAPRH
jgi:hypothetical protein